MSKISTFIQLCRQRSGIGRALISNFSHCALSHGVPDKLYLKLQYRLMMGKRLDLKHPKEFNAKLQWLKLYDRNPEYMRLVDKYEVKRYIADKIGAQYVIPTLGVWDRVEDISFDALPNSFVLKCTHDSGSTIICKDKSTFDVEGAKARLQSRLRGNLFWHGREWPYKALKPRVIAEQYMIDAATAELRDYKFFCFNGVCRCLKVDFDRFVDHHANYYDPQGNRLDFGEAVCPPNKDKNIVLPHSLKKMIALAEILSKDVPFLRVDFYEVNGRIYFGELTFFPASGFGPFVPEEADYKLGEWLALPEKKRVFNGGN